LLGLLLAFFQTRFMQTEHAVESYLWFLLALWTVFPGSLPVLSQIAVYFFWPIYIYLSVKVLGNRSETSPQREHGSPLLALRASEGSRVLS
jgi:hypothetical protein